MRDRQRILSNLEALYREGFEKARARGEQERMDRLDMEYQRDQLWFEVLLDLRDLLLPAPADPEEGGVTSLIDKAQKLRNLTRLR